MPALKFSTMVGKASIFATFKTDPNFSHFVFQLSNSDVGDRKTHDLIIYAVFKTSSDPVLLNPSALDWKATSSNSINSKIVMGNLTLGKDTLVKLFDLNPRVSFFGFKAEKLGSGNQDKYVEYMVYPCDASGNPTIALAAFTTTLNPSPPRGIE